MTASECEQDLVGNTHARTFLDIYHPRCEDNLACFHSTQSKPHHWRRSTFISLTCIGLPQVRYSLIELLSHNMDIQPTKEDADRIGNYALMLLSDQNIDRRKCHRIVPLEVLSLGYSRTGTMCKTTLLTLPFLSSCYFTRVLQLTYPSQQCKTPSASSAIQTLTTSPASTATSATATCGLTPSAQNMTESVPPSAVPSSTSSSAT